MRRTEPSTPRLAMDFRLDSREVGLRLSSAGSAPLACARTALSRERLPEMMLGLVLAKPPLLLMLAARPAFRLAPPVMQLQQRCVSHHAAGALRGLLQIAASKAEVEQVVAQLKV